MVKEIYSMNHFYHFITFNALISIIIILVIIFIILSMIIITTIILITNIHSAMMTTMKSASEAPCHGASRHVTPSEAPELPG